MFSDNGIKLAIMKGLVLFLISLSYCYCDKITIIIPQVIKPIGFEYKSTTSIDHTNSETIKNMESFYRMNYSLCQDILKDNQVLPISCKHFFKIHSKPSGVEFIGFSFIVITTYLVAMLFI